jgi:acetylornithine deacetylase/succinyl-diaminopimelate desuccinylase-like protein
MPPRKKLTHVDARGAARMVDVGAKPVTQRRAVARALLRVADRLGTAPPALVPSTGTSDLRHFAKRGIPGVLYGPGRGVNPHRAGERYELADLAPMIRFFVELAAEWCGHAAVQV